MTVLAIIPARGGSKRIPLKNIRDFLGVPILARVVRTVIESGIADEVLVSTDHEGVREVAIGAGARVPFMRSERTSSDHATLHEVILEALSNGKHEAVETVVCVLPTAVLLEPDTLRRAAQVYREQDSDSLISVQRFRHPVQRALSISAGGHLERPNPATHSMRTQDATPLFHDAGQFYFAKVNGLTKRLTLMGSKCIPFELSELEARDIDEPADWLVAEALFTARELLRKDAHGGS